MGKVLAKQNEDLGSNSQHPPVDGYGRQNMQYLCCRRKPWVPWSVSYLTNELQFYWRCCMDRRKGRLGRWGGCSWSCLNNMMVWLWSLGCTSTCKGRTDSTMLSSDLHMHARAPCAFTSTQHTHMHTHKYDTPHATNIHTHIHEHAHTIHIKKIISGDWGNMVGHIIC